MDPTDYDIVVWIIVIFLSRLDEKLVGSNFQQPPVQ